MSVAENILRDLLDEIVKQLQYKHAEISVKELTSGGANYTSALYSATITSPHEDSLKLFAKVANVSEKLREASTNVNAMFRTEQFVYSDLVKVYEKIQDEHNVSPEHRFVFPKCFGAKSTAGEETVIMEDLMAKDYGTYNRFKSVDWEHAASAVVCLARFHALSFAYQKDDYENFAKVADKLKFDLKEQADNPNMAELWKKMIGTAVDAVKEEHKERLMKYICTDAAPKEFVKAKSPLSTPVLCHGDYRVSNLMFRQSNGRLETIAVDYQTVHIGCPPADLLYLEFMSTDEEFRKKYHERLVDCYFKELTVALDRLGLDVTEVYPRETFDSELKRVMGPALLVASFILPMVLVEASQAPQLGGFKSFDDFDVSTTELFAERFSGVVSDCVRWGVI